MVNFLKITIFIFFTIISCEKINDKPSGSSKAKSIYNQAYQENWDADKVEDIVKEAKNAYILIDPFMDNISINVSSLKANGNEVGAYISIGTGENWRDDFSDLEPFLVSEPWSNWAGEYFVKETTTGIVPLMKARIDKIASWGCDWVEFDNMDWVFDDNYRSTYGFTVTQEEGTAFYQDLCDYVHKKGMKCMAKNMTEGAENFDGVLYESYDIEKNWWDVNGAKAFLAAGKLVIINHYHENDCDKVYTDYMKKYSSDLSFICEDEKLKKYIHYNE